MTEAGPPNSHIEGDAGRDLDGAIRRLFETQARKRQRYQSTPAGDLDGELSVRFIETSHPDRHALPTTFLGTALKEIQTSLNYTVWSQEAGPNVQGDVPGSIARSAATEVVSLDSGSFVVVLRKAEPELSDSFSRAVDLILDLVAAADENAFGDEVEDYVHRMGTAAAVRLERFFRRVGDAGRSLDVTWRGGDIRSAFLSDVQAIVLAGWLGNAIATSETIEIEGILKMADVDVNRFKLLDPSTEAVYEGKSRVELSHVEIDGIYRASIEIVTSTAPVSGDKKQKMTLLALMRK